MTGPLGAEPAGRWGRHAEPWDVETIWTLSQAPSLSPTGDWHESGEWRKKPTGPVNMQTRCRAAQWSEPADAVLRAPGRSGCWWQCNGSDSSGEHGPGPRAGLLAQLFQGATIEISNMLLF